MLGASGDILDIATWANRVAALFLDANHLVLATDQSKMPGCSPRKQYAEVAAKAKLVYAKHFINQGPSMNKSLMFILIH